MDKVEADAAKTLQRWQQRAQWRIRNEFAGCECHPHVLDIVDSLYELASDRCLSIARLADGEFGLMTGVARPSYQAHDKGLASALKDVMTCDKPNCRVAIPKYFLYYSPTCGHPQGEDRWLARIFCPDALKGDYFRYFRPDYLYLDACMSVPRMHYGHIGAEFVSAYYVFVKKMLRGEDVILVTGDYRHATMQYRLLEETADTVTTIKVPAKNAWSEHERVRDELLRMNPYGSHTVVMCCGPLATVLAYELSDDMRCLDLGHMLADYNMSRGGKSEGNFWE